MSDGRWARIARASVEPLAALGVLALGLAARLFVVDDRITPSIWFLGLVVLGAPVVWRTVRGMLRGEFATDVVAMLAILVAVIQLQPLAGLVIVLMQTGGEALERYAEGRASRAVRELEAAAPRIAHRQQGDGWDDIDVDAIAVGDRLLVRPGEMFPCDAEVLAGRSAVDTSRLTGEPVPVTAEVGTLLPSGALNGEGPLEVRALKPSAESLYARIVELVRSAQESKAPLQRLADRYAVWFTPLTLLACAVAYLLSGDWLRVLSVLVVATPCPLILATPVAIIGGINRAARRMIIVRTGSALEGLSRVRVAVFDKTGTLTVGRPVVARVEALGTLSANDALRLAAGVEVGSAHLLASTLVDAARAATGAPPEATGVNEAPGRGIAGTVEGHDVAVGSPRWLAERYAARAAELTTLADRAEGLRAFVMVDGVPAAIVHYADALRPGVPQVLARLRALGVARTLLLSGDHGPNAEKIARSLGITEVRGDLLPQDKVTIVQELVARGEAVLMVGDGTNDAPALASATVGIALAGHGGGITAEAADAVLLVDELDRVADAIEIGQRTIRVARQSIGWGLGLSGVAMLVAGAGYIPPTIGALVQEAIDVAVILNALRTSRA
ncbi:MAG: heavy metal translocating P-type ATPase [Gemmatimonadetes bacterium]|nr:heavy metal translocating P-type ATPase [Gemmatimonadota bacterium]